MPQPTARTSDSDRPDLPDLEDTDLTGIPAGPNSAGIDVQSDTAPYLRAVVGELRKTVWPSRAEMVKNTVTTLVFTLGATAVLSAGDYGLSRLMTVIFTR